MCIWTLFQMIFISDRVQSMRRFRADFATVFTPVFTPGFTPGFTFCSFNFPECRAGRFSFRIHAGFTVRLNPRWELTPPVLPENFGRGGLVRSKTQSTLREQKTLPACGRGRSEHNGPRPAEHKWRHCRFETF